MYPKYARNVPGGCLKYFSKQDFIHIKELVRHHDLAMNHDREQRFIELDEMCQPDLATINISHALLQEIVNTIHEIKSGESTYGEYTALFDSCRAACQSLEYKTL